MFIINHTIFDSTYTKNLLKFERSQYNLIMESQNTRGLVGRHPSGTHFPRKDNGTSKSTSIMLPNCCLMAILQQPTLLYSLLMKLN